MAGLTCSIIYLIYILDKSVLYIIHDIFSGSSPLSLRTREVGSIRSTRGVELEV